MALSGSLILVVGPSGVGKDTLMSAAREKLQHLKSYVFCRRVITRARDAGGEDHLAVSEETFQHMRRKGTFLHHWSVHGLHYGIPVEVLDQLQRGVHVIVNVSRKEIAPLKAHWPNSLVLSIEASKETLRERLLARGRETAEQVDQRLAREVKLLDNIGPVIRILNDGDLEKAKEAFLRAIVGGTAPHFRMGVSSVDFGMRNVCIISRRHPAAALLRSQDGRVTIIRGDGKPLFADLVFDDGDVDLECCVLDSRLARLIGAAPGDLVGLSLPQPSRGLAAIRKKIAGEELTPLEIDIVVHDMITRRSSAVEVTGFLVGAARHLSMSEVTELTKARASRIENIKWSNQIVVDKHSMGGIPGNRITPIIVSIVTAAGLVMPKTSSRAITSASGTADAMEVIANVNLSPDQLRSVVRETGGCVAWNGKLTHSPVDDVMNMINSPLGLRSYKLDVSSILSKKLAAGSTHVLIDLPVGREAKVRTAAEADELESLFIAVGAEIGISVKAMRVDGGKPIGRGIGPVLEMRDAFAVLENRPDAPEDLRSKAILYAATILEWVGVAPPGKGAELAAEIVRSGRAREKFMAIARAQGLRAEQPPEPGPIVEEFRASEPMHFPGFSVQAISAIARAVGAPFAPQAGLELLVGGGTYVERGAPLLRLHAVTESGKKMALDTIAQRKQTGTLFAS